MKIILKKKNCWIIALENHEQLSNVVEAWARASFEMAKPAGISALTSYNPGTEWQHIRTEALKRPYAAVTPKYLLEMDYVAGRRCKTTIVRGRKYLTIYPGDEREQEIETMYLLAMRFLAQINLELQKAASQTNSIQ
jgi:hypothetical protein